MGAKAISFYVVVFLLFTSSSAFARRVAFYEGINEVESSRPIEIPRLSGFKYVANKRSAPFFDQHDIFVLTSPLASSDFALENVACDEKKCDFLYHGRSDYEWASYLAPGSAILKEIIDGPPPHFEVGESEVYAGIRRMIRKDPVGYRNSKTLVCSSFSRDVIDRTHHHTGRQENRLPQSIKGTVCRWANDEELYALASLKPKVVTVRIDGNEIYDRESLEQHWQGKLWLGFQCNSSEEKFGQLIDLKSCRFDLYEFSNVIAGSDTPARRVGAFTIFSDKSYRSGGSQDTFLATEPVALDGNIGSRVSGPYSKSLKSLWRPLEAPTLQQLFENSVDHFINPPAELLRAYDQISDRANQDLWVIFNGTAPFQTLEMEFPLNLRTEMDIQKIEIDCLTGAQTRVIRNSPEIRCPVKFTYRIRKG